MKFFGLAQRCDDLLKESSSINVPRLSICFFNVKFNMFECLKHFETVFCMAVKIEFYF